MNEALTQKPACGVFTGLQPTNGLHVGNFLGTLRQFLAFPPQIQPLMCIVDLHAMTINPSPQQLRAHTMILAAELLACGVDARTLFVQSHNPDHCELAWMLGCVARLGWLNRMTQFKEKAGKHRENASIGLFQYPVLMAADILAYKARYVPVGDDQQQHLELTRDIAEKFNHDYHPILHAPRRLTLSHSARVKSLRDAGKKMSKSDSSDMSRLNLNDEPDRLALKVQKARTDSGAFPSTIEESTARPEARNLLDIMVALQVDAAQIRAQLEQKIPLKTRPIIDLEAESDLALLERFFSALAGVEAELFAARAQEVVNEFGGRPFSDFKKRLTELLIDRLTPLRARRAEFLSDQVELKKLLQDSARRARTISAPILKDVREAVGL